MSSSSSSSTTASRNLPTDIIINNNNNNDDEHQEHQQQPNNDNNDEIVTTTINLLDLAATCIACTEAAARVITKIATTTTATNHPQQEHEQNYHSTIPPTPSIQQQQQQPVVTMNTRCKEDGTLVTNADFAAQRIFISGIRNISPQIHIISEEKQEDDDDDSKNNNNNSDGRHRNIDNETTTTNDTTGTTNDILYKAQQEIRLRYHRKTSKPLPLAQQLQIPPQLKNAINDNSSSHGNTKTNTIMTSIHQQPDDHEATITTTIKEIVVGGSSSPLNQRDAKNMNSHEHNITDINNDSGKNDPEEDECHVNVSRVSVIIDPLDGTKSYTLGEYHVVTTLIAILVDHIPVFGVIGKPFGYHNNDTISILNDEKSNCTNFVTPILDTNFVIIYGGSLLKSVYVAGGREIIAPPIIPVSSSSMTTSTNTDIDDEHVNRDIEETSRIDDDKNSIVLPRAVISSSRSNGIVQDFCTHLAQDHHLIHPEPMYVSGAGEKSLRLIVPHNHEALWFFPKRGTSIWDVAASDAILRTLGGRLTDKYGHDINYAVSSRNSRRNKNDSDNTTATTENMNGVVACIDTTLHAKCIELYRQGDWDNRQYD